MSLLYKKKIFIYEKNNSIPYDLCNDIIEIYENSDYKEVNKKHNIHSDSHFTKLRCLLIEELIKNMNEYIKTINKMSKCTLLKTDNIKFNMLSFFIKNIKITEEVSNQEAVPIKLSNRVKNNQIKKLMFVWFLNDYDGEIIFWNEYTINPKCGKLLIFPVSWCFSYEEIIKLEQDKYIIYGYIYE